MVVAGPALQACVPAQLPGLSLFLSELLRLPCFLTCSPCSVSGPGSWLRTDVHPHCMNLSAQSLESESLHEREMGLGAVLLSFLL